MPRATSLRHWARTHPYWVLTLLLILGVGIPFYLRPGSEWENTYVGAAQFLLSGEDLHQVDYLYPPFMALLAVPFTFMPPAIMRLSFYALNVACLIFMCRWAWTISAWTISGGAELEGKVSRNEHVIFFLGLACAFRYILDGFAHQQPDIIIGCLVLGGCLALSRGRHFLGAGTIGLAGAMKCTPLLFGIYLLWKRRWTAALWLGMVAVGVNLLPDAVSPCANGRWRLSEWAQRYLLPMNNNDSYPGTWGSDIIYNQSLSGLLQRYLASDWFRAEGGYRARFSSEPVDPTVYKIIVYGTEAVLLVLAGLAMAWRRNPTGKQRRDEPSCQAYELSVVLLLMVLLSPMSSKPHFATLVLPGFCLARRVLPAREKIPGILLGLALMCNLLGCQFWPDALSSLALVMGNVTWQALFLLAGCIYCLMVKRQAGPDLPSDWNDLLGRRIVVKPRPEHKSGQRSRPPQDSSLARAER